MTGPPEDLRVLSAGAAQGLVASMAPQFLADTGVALQTTFGAVGAIREKLLAGEPCDVLILTAAMLDELAARGHVDESTCAALGQVRTGIGVRATDALPDIEDRAALERSLRAATDIYLPDPQRATAGIHFQRVLEQLGLFEELAPRLRPHPEWRDGDARDGAEPRNRPDRLHADQRDQVRRWRDTGRSATEGIRACDRLFGCRLGRRTAACTCAAFRETAVRTGISQPSERGWIRTLGAATRLAARLDLLGQRRLEPAKQGASEVRSQRALARLHHDRGEHAGEQLDVAELRHFRAGHRHAHGEVG